MCLKKKIIKESERKAALDQSMRIEGEFTSMKLPYDGIITLSSATSTTKQLDVLFDSGASESVVTGSEKFWVNRENHVRIRWSTVVIKRKHHDRIAEDDKNIDGLWRPSTHLVPRGPMQY